MVVRGRGGGGGGEGSFPAAVEKARGDPCLIGGLIWGRWKDRLTFAGMEHPPRTPPPANNRGLGWHSRAMRDEQAK